MEHKRPFEDLVKAIRVLTKRKSSESETQTAKDTCDSLGASVISCDVDSILDHIVVIQPQSGARHTATVIFLHGSGGGNGGLRRHLAMQASPGMGHIKWILPKMKRRPLSIARGCLLPAWFDIYQGEDSLQGPWDYEGIALSINAIQELIKKETKGDAIAKNDAMEHLNVAESSVSHSRVPSHRVVIAGLSQGGSMAIWVSLTYAEQLAGMAILSAQLAAREKFADNISAHARLLSVFQAHGKLDEVVPFHLGEELCRWLKDTVGLEEFQNREGTGPVGIQFNQYDNLGHAIDDEEWEDFGRWLRSVIPAEL